jgi:ABC-type uncharacterized transport system involved in gliding motility auxiliary subunit
MAFKDQLQGATGKKIFAGTNLVVYTLAGLAIVVVLNWFVERNNKRWDLTPDKKYTLSEQTAKILKRLEKDVTIYCFDREGGARARKDLLGNYEVLSRHVKVRFVDPDRNPALAKQYGIRSYGTIVAATADKHFEAQGENEEGVTNAIVRLLKGQKSIYFIQGHGERDIENTDRGGLSNFKKALENENYVIKSHVLMQNLTLPADATLVVVAGPRNDFLPQETEALSKYLTGGGRALLMLDPAVELPNLTQMLAAWNVKMRNDLVIDENPIAQIFGTRPEMPLVLKYGSSPIVQPLARTATLFPLTRSFEVARDFKQGVSADSLCETTADSYGVQDFNPKMTMVTYRDGKDVRGPLSVAVAASITSGEGEQKKEGRLVAMGTSSGAANNYLGFQGNRDLIMNMVNWLAADEDLISIRPKTPDAQQLNLNQKQMRTIFLGGVVGLPLLIIIAGTAVWFRRRR